MVRKQYTEVDGKCSKDVWSVEEGENNGTIVVADIGMVFGPVENIADRVNTDILKLKTDVVKWFLDWSDLEGIHEAYSDKVDIFVGLSNDATDSDKQQLSIGLELMSLIREIRRGVSTKLDAVHDDLARHIGVMRSKDVTSDS